MPIPPESIIEPAVVAILIARRLKVPHACPHCGGVMLRPRRRLIDRLFPSARRSVRCRDCGRRR